MIQSFQKHFMGLQCGGVIEGWQSSGCSKACYCRASELNYSMFNYWLAKLITPKQKSTNLVPVAVNPAIDAKDAR